MTTIGDIIKAAIVEAGGDGLANGRVECGCAVEDLAPCDGPDINECRIATRRVLGDDEYLGDCGPGDLWFTPIEDGSK